MENKNERCSTCKHYSRYYTRGVKRFSQTTYGYCSVRKENADIHESCEDYRKRACEKISSMHIKRCLNDLLTEISEIRHVIEDVYDERKV